MSKTPFDRIDQIAVSELGIPQIHSNISAMLNKMHMLSDNKNPKASPEASQLQVSP